MDCETCTCTTQRATAPCTVLSLPDCALSVFFNNSLSGTMPSSLSSLTGLTNLCVPGAEGRPCTALKLPACALSDLSTNQLSGTIPLSLGSLTLLQNMCVQHCMSPLNFAEAFHL